MSPQVAQLYVLSLTLPCWLLGNVFLPCVVIDVPDKFKLVDEVCGVTSGGELIADEEFYEFECRVMINEFR